MIAVQTQHHSHYISSHQAPIEKAGGCLHVHCAKSEYNSTKKDNFKLPRSPIFSTQITDLSGVERTCVGTAWKSSRQDLKFTATLVVPEEFFE